MNQRWGEIGRVNGTLATVLRNGRSVTRNVSCFKRGVLNKESSAKGPSYDEEEIQEAWGHPAKSSTEAPLPRQEGDASPAQQLSGPREPDPKCQEEATSRSPKHDLCPNLTPSQRLRSLVSLAYLESPAVLEMLTLLFLFLDGKMADTLMVEEAVLDKSSQGASEKASRPAHLIQLRRQQIQHKPTS
ncbi:hypothetical protein NDU88_009889 [Pleurodeles waltl]|uniref:Uncharacterized protein n=1 Tax=Pleurodeles waltl TaxID=8319 RepID=A0AAV7PX91_PLEWA|nr:hypothetical protein NDU88_009889 [Pleurodeles waltl]